MKNKKIYLPKDDDVNLFKIRTSDNAIIIFLDYFGYPKIHITLYVKELSEDERLFDIHVKNEKTSKNIYQNSIKINVPETEKEIQERLLDLNRDFVNLIKEYKKKAVKRGNLLCLNCFVQDKLRYPEKLNSKIEAQKFYSGILDKTIKFDIEELKQCNNCQNPKHDTFIDDKFQNMYLKNKLGLFTFKDQVDFSNKLILLLKSTFQKEIDHLEKIINEIKLKLNEVKNE